MMIKLTKDSIGKVYVDGFGLKHEIIKMRHCMFLAESIDPDCPNGTFHLDLFYSDGRMKHGDVDNCNLVSIYVKPRTRKEIVEDLVESIEFFNSDNIDYSVGVTADPEYVGTRLGYVKLLLQEAKEKDWKDE